MPVIQEVFGVHKDVTQIEFGKCDLFFFTATEHPSPFANLLCLAQTPEPMDQMDADARLRDLSGKNLNEVSHVKVIFKFDRPEMVTELIRVLAHLQKDLFMYQDWAENPDKITFKPKTMNLEQDNLTPAEMPKYKCHKEVWAFKIKSIVIDGEGENRETDGSALITPEEDGYAPFKVDYDYMQKHKPKVGGYYVVYKDGYKSFSPADVFEDGYSRMIAGE